MKSQQVRRSVFAAVTVALLVLAVFFAGCQGVSIEPGSATACIPLP